MTELLLSFQKRLEYFRISKIIVLLLFILIFIFEGTRELLIASSIDAYVAVTSFVGATLLMFYTLEKKKTLIFQNILKKIQN